MQASRTPPATHATTGTAPTQAEHGIVILCADEEVRNVLAYWLDTHSAKAAVAQDGYQAAEWLGESTQVLITDRVLPPWPGLDSLAMLHHRFPRLRIVFIESGNVHDGILARVTGASVLLQRPLSRHALNDALKQANI